MENKKTKVAIIIVILLIIALMVVSYFYNDFNSKQVTLLTQELNEILDADLKEDSINFDIKTEKNYAEVEKTIKEYISRLKHIYVEMEEIVSGINPNIVFSTQNIPEKNLDEIDNIINEYKEKSQNLILEYETLTTEENIIKNINDANITTRKDYYVELYNEIMLSQKMKNKFEDLDEEIKNEKARLYDKINKIEKMKTFLKEHEDSWTLKDDKIQSTNLNRMTEYYNLLNQIID